MMRTRSPRKVDDIPIAPSLYSLSNKMGNSLLAVRDINHIYIVVEGRKYYANKKMPDYVQNRNGEFHDAENQGGQAN